MPTVRHARHCEALDCDWSPLLPVVEVQATFSACGQLPGMRCVNMLGPQLSATDRVRVSCQHFPKPAKECWSVCVW